MFVLHHLRIDITALMLDCSIFRYFFWYLSMISTVIYKKNRILKLADNIKLFSGISASSDVEDLTTGFTQIA